jgi:hypothetical protein
MNFIHGPKGLKQVADLFGLGDKPIRSIVLRFDCDDAAEAEVVFLPTEEEAGGLARRYLLVERADPVEAPR